MFDHYQSVFSRLNCEAKVGHLWNIIMTVQVDLIIYISFISKLTQTQKSPSIRD